jgi:hypothetical protein
MKFAVFGKMDIDVVREEGQWIAYRLGGEGKKRKLHDLKFPSSLTEAELLGYVEDVYHEWASSKYQSVKLID